MKKKSAQVALTRFQQALGQVRTYLADVVGSTIANGPKVRCYDHAVIWTYRAFEEFVLDALVVQINKNPQHLYDAVGVAFGKNPTVAQCEYLLMGDRYFDFRGHSGLIELIKKVSPPGSQLETAAKNAAGRQGFEILVGLRNYVAHESDQSKLAGLKAMKNWEPGRQNLGSAGQWLRIEVNGQTRMERLLLQLDAYAQLMRDAL